MSLDSRTVHSEPERNDDTWKNGVGPRTLAPFVSSPSWLTTRISTATENHRVQIPSHTFPSGTRTLHTPQVRTSPHPTPDVSANFLERRHGRHRTLLQTGRKGQRYVPYISNHRPRPEVPTTLCREKEQGPVRESQKGPFMRGKTESTKPLLPETSQTSKGSVLPVLVTKGTHSSRSDRRVSNTTWTDVGRPTTPRVGTGHSSSEPATSRVSTTCTRVSRHLVETGNNSE